MNNASDSKLYAQVASGARADSSVPPGVLAFGEILWDVFDGSKRLGGAPLNFAVHVSRMGHQATLISAVGRDVLGTSALTEIQGLGINTGFIQTTARYQTGTALVRLGEDGQARFVIQRPASYDAVLLSDREIALLAKRAPRWMYHGTLFLTTEQGRRTFRQLASALPEAATVYDPNLRPGCYSAQLVVELLASARAVKLSESEMYAVAEFADLPSGAEAFCCAGARRYGWLAAAVTLGERGCAVWVDGRFFRLEGMPVDVADTVGAGDAFTAAFVHGLSLGWPPKEIAAFANRVGALVASRPGGIPEWSMDEVPAVARRR